MDMAYALNFSPRKRRILERFVGLPVRPWNGEPGPGTLYVWGSDQAPQEWQGQVCWVEDGFIRSNGLGAAFAEPVSWILDDLGPCHEDAACNRLEVMLQNEDVDEMSCRLGRGLQRKIRFTQISKYNEPPQADLLIHDFPIDREVVLVIGQVPGDSAVRSIRTPVRSNADLIKSVRELRPDAWIIYKPHPDVLYGLREDDTEEIKKQGIFDEIVSHHVPLRSFLSWVDEVHVMNSLSGFEALIHGKKVVCHATPFYAGWGLTQDVFPCARRTKVRTIEELLWIALACYPRYVHPKTGEQLSVFGAIDYLVESLNESHTLRYFFARLFRRLTGLNKT